MAFNCFIELVINGTGVQDTLHVTKKVCKALHKVFKEAKQYLHLGKLTECPQMKD